MINDCIRRLTCRFRLWTVMASLILGAAFVPVLKAANGAIQLSISVEDKLHQPVPNLSTRDFSLKIDGEVVSPASVKYVGDQPVDWVLLVDCSNSMRGEELWKPSIQEAEAELTSLMGDRGDRVALVAISTEPIILQQLTADQALLNAAILKLHPVGATALNDSVLAAVRYLVEKSTPERRKIVWVISDGQDNQSQLRIEEWEGFFYGLGIPIVMTRVGEHFGSAPIEKLIKNSGGRMIAPDSKRTCAEDAKMFASFSMDSYQISLEVSSSSGDHRLEISTSRSGIRIADPKRRLRLSGKAKN